MSFAPHHRSLVRRLPAPLAGLCLLVVGLAVVGSPSASAAPIAAYAVYGFAEQKVYGMTLATAPGASGTLVGTNFNVKMSNKAAFNTVPSVSNNGGLDAPQSYLSSGLPPKPPENFSGNANPGMSFPANERVLLQANPTGAGVAQGIDVSNPVPGNFIAGRNFARGDGYATVNPDTGIAPPGAGSIPANVPPGAWPPSGDQVPAGKLFATVGTPGTLSIDLVSEALLDGEGYATIASGASDWVVTGGFSIVGPATARAAVALDFSLVERLVVYSWSSEFDIASASNALTLDVLDSAGRSVFGPFLGANPSTTRMLTTEFAAAATYNNNTLVPTHSYPGPVNVNFQTMPLAPGAYSFTIKGTTTAYVTAVPEPATNACLVLAVICGGGQVWRLRRRRS